MIEERNARFQTDRHGGTIHLAEDCVHFEWLPVEGSDLMSPVVSDFTRTAQAMLRYRMNDLLQLGTGTCKCGSPLLTVSRIEGRMDDVLLLPQRDGTLRSITPDVIRNAVCDADPRILDYRVVQSGSGRLEVSLDAGQLPELSPCVLGKLAALFDGMGLEPVSISFEPLVPPPYDRKLRRVRREWQPQR